jgi:DNA-directed RNA polymerase subunit RPC12/RpoP
MKCAECDTEVDQSIGQDYLCPRCRIAMEPKEWDERERVVNAVNEWLRSRGIVYYGHEIMYPQDSPWAWVKVYEDKALASDLVGQASWDARSYDTFLTRGKLKWFYVWKKTGNVYEAGQDGAVGDDPIFVPSVA